MGLVVISSLLGSALFGIYSLFCYFVIAALCIAELIRSTKDDNTRK